MKESYDFLNEDEDQKSYIKTHISDKGYDEADFLSYLWTKKGESSNEVENWPMDELKSVIQEYINTKNNNTILEFKDIGKIENKDNIIEFQNTEKTDKKIIKQNKIKKMNENNYVRFTVYDYLKLEDIKVEIISDEKKSKGFLKSLSSMTFYVSITNFSLSVKRKYSDFEWLYKLIVNNYKYYFLPQFPRGSFSLFGYNETELENIGEKLEKLMNVLVNDPILKNTKVMFDFLTIENYKDFQSFKKIYEKVKLSTLTIDDDIKENEENEEEDIYTYNNYDEQSILREKDYKDNNEVPSEIQSCRIFDTIVNYLNQENYADLRNYCYNCSKDPVNKEIMINTLETLYNEGKNNVYAKIDKLEILKILTFLNKKNCMNYYQKMIDLIKDINNVKSLTMDEYFTRINKFSEIIKERLFNINFLEKLGEENLRHIRAFIDIYYKGQEKDAVHNYLKEKYVDIINDYNKVICEKYNINKEKILKKLKNLDENDDMEDQINHLIQSLDEHEQLYYDLLVQSILEAPSSESAIKSWTIPIVKIIKKALGTFIGTAITSFTGSKILMGLTASVGTVSIISDISDIYLKSHYFSENGEFRKLYHINQRNSYDKRWNIMKRNIKEGYHKMINPIKNCYYHIIDKKFLKIKEKKIGFQRDEEMVNIEEDANKFVTKFIALFISDFDKKKELNFYNKVMKMKEQFRSKKKRDKKFREIIETSEEREKEVMNIIRNDTEALEQKYPQYKENTFIQKKVNSLKKFGLKVKTIFKTVFYDESKKKKTNSQIRLEIINDHNYKEYLKELDSIQKTKKDLLSQILIDEVYSMCKLNKYDKELFQKIQHIKDEEKENLKNEISNNLNLENNEVKNEVNAEEKIDNEEKDDEKEKLILTKDKIIMSYLDEPLIDNKNKEDNE